VWFYPESMPDIAELDFKYLPDNAWLLRTKEVIQASVDRWQNRIFVGFCDLGGALDVISTFRSPDAMIFDLFDHPEELKRLIWEMHEVWWRYYEEFEAITASANPGYSGWAAIFSEDTYYILQCDFAYMIGPEMFDEFVKPELTASARKLANAFYHLDGQGQLAYLDSLLEIEAIAGIQWVPGAGSPDITHWPDVYKKISDSGKKIHLIPPYTEDPFDVIDKIVEQTGRADNIVYHVTGDLSQRDRAEAMLEKYDCN
jgi:hypothetical protein